ncbi:MAG TPA: DNA topoisomerase VI subunit B [Natrialbaceae archaeon]|nr:DNA topoisomerase VI subunit B [Natrialbaceae archaeon]
MTSFQSTLGEEPGIAEELAESQRAISIAEFFEKNKHMLGFDSGARAMVTAVKEAVDNALDAAEEAGIYPDIYVEIEESGDYYRLVVEDNGPGITKEQVPKVFGKLLYGSRFHKREQARGQQGIGISAAVLYSQLTSGKPVTITSRPKGASEARRFDLLIDTDDNEPEIKGEERTSWDRPHGTRIEMEMEANMRARTQLHQYVRNTAVVNPHARIELREPNAHLKSERAENAELPAETEEIQPHPHGVELGTLRKMLEATDSHSVSGFLQNEFTRVGKKTADGVIAAFKDRHFGREMSWSVPGTHESADVEGAVAEATANKGQAATESFATAVADGVADRDRIAHHEVVEVVAEAAEDTAEETGTTFGDTVQEKAVAAAWVEIVGAGDEGDTPEGKNERERRRADCYRIVDDATSSRKDDATVEGVASRLAAKFANAEDDRDRVTRDTLREFLDRAADMTEEREDVTFGETARENVVEAVWERARTVPDDPPLVRELVEDRDAASQLLEGMRETDIMAPPTSCLSPITEGLVEAGLKKEFDADFYAAATRDAEVHGGDPFVVEAGIAYGGDLEADGTVELLRFANRVPLVYQRGACATTDVIKNIGWRNYNLDQPGGSGLPNGPAVIMIHVASTNVPFTSESKDALANIPAIEDEIELAVREAARELKSYLNKRQTMQKRRRKQDKLATLLPAMAEKLSSVTAREELNIDDSLARIMNNVLVDRERKDGTVRLIVENNTDVSVDPEITDIVSAEPEDANGATVVELDDEWFVKWSPSIPGGEEATLEYRVSEDAEFDVSIEGVEDEKLTVNA